MNPKHLYIILWTTLIGLDGASDCSGGTKSTIEAVVNVDISATNTSGCKDAAKPLSAAAASKDKDSDESVHTVSVLANSSGPVPRNAQKIVLKPNQPVLISVESGPSGGSGNNSSALGINGLPLDILGNPENEGEKDKKKVLPPIIPQNVQPAAKIIAISAGDQGVLDSIAQQPTLTDLSGEELNEQLGKYIDFMREMRKVHLHRSIKLPRLVFIGDNDEIKYRIIETILGVPGCLTPDASAMVLTPRFPAAIRFTLRNDPHGEAGVTSFKIAGDAIDASDTWTPLQGPGSLYKALQASEAVKKSQSEFLMSEVAVEVEIRSSGIPTLIFMDLPLKAPASNDSVRNEAILARLLRKYLGQAWGVTIAVGNGNQTFDAWQTLSLMRTFDSDLKRTFPLGFDPPRGEDVRLEGIVQGLQEAFPTLHDRIYYMTSTTAADEELKQRTGLCSLTRCGREALVQGLQRRLLRTWNAMKRDILRTIEAVQEQLKERISGYDGYWALPDGEKKWDALIGQVSPILHEKIIFAPEDRDESLCTGSPLDLVKASIFEKKSVQDEDAADTPPSWSQIFADYQEEIAHLSRIPETVDWVHIRSVLGELQTSGPTRHVISKLKTILHAQLETLKGPKSRLMERVRQAWRTGISRSLSRKYSLEPFPHFKTAVLRASEDFLKTKMAAVSRVMNEIDVADESVGWTYRFIEMGSGGERSLWMELMKTENAEGALELLKRDAEAGFTEITSRHAILQPRLIISTLLTRQSAQSLIASLHQNHKKLQLTAMTKESIEQLTNLEKSVKTMEQLKGMAE
jgi:hypothetical protein